MEYKYKSNWKHGDGRADNSDINLAPSTPCPIAIYIFLKGMAGNRELRVESSCDLVASRTTLDPLGDVILAFNSKDLIVSDALALDILTAQELVEE